MKTDRRKFIKLTAGASVGSVISVKAGGLTNPPATTPPPILPKRLKVGDTIGLIAPGYAINDQILEETKMTLAQLGFKTYHTPRILGRHGYFSNEDEQRAADINLMFGKPEIDAVLCVRGGYGCTRILEALDYDLIAQHPKILLGFSDITALLNSIHHKTGLVTFHGPVGSTMNDTYSIQYIKELLVNAAEELVIKNPVLSNSLLKNPEYERYTISRGKARGKLAGGSLTLINALIGTPYEIDFTDKIVCIEDVEEAPYRIDRLLTQLISGRTFSKAAAIVFGVCAGCNETTNPNSFSLKEVILDRIKPLNIPAVYGMSFGHIKHNFSFPIGHYAELSTEKMELKIDGAAVI